MCDARTWSGPPPRGHLGRTLRYQQLVEFLGPRFTQIDQRFTQIDQRFTQIDRVLGVLSDDLADLRREMLGHFDEIYRRLERLEQEYQAITQALRRIEAGLADERRRREIIERDLAELKRYVAALQARIEEIEQRLAD
jgi:chromosome segregation ATPase